MLYNIYDILSVNSAHSEYIPRFFMQKKTGVINSAQDCDLLINDLKSLPSSLVEVASSTYHNLDDDSIIYSTHLAGIHIAWSVKNLEGKRTEVKISRGYRLWSELIKIPIGGILPVGIFLKVILHLKLLLKGYSFVMAGCVIPVDSDHGILVSAPNAMGKTSVVVEFVRNHEAGFVADDTVIVGGSENTALSYPQPMRIRPKWKLDFLPFMEKNVAPETVFDTKYAANVENLFFLERAADNSIEEISNEAAVAKLTAINRKILSFQSENTIIWYAGCNPSFRLATLANKELLILSEFLKGKNCFVVQYSGRPSYAVNLIKNFCD